ncbi:MAG: hypothetical protein DRN57_07970 [Thermoplasmata archaeon]|nr:MAG: hypothetical protein DRN57_07970 [Thermoplasmata archaeon]
MEMIIRILVFFMIGVFAGSMSGLFGIGGGSIRIPLLNLAGLPLLSAYGINLFVIPLSSLVGAYSHRKNIVYRIGPYMIIGGTLGSVIGALLAGMIPTLVLAMIFVSITILTVLAIYVEKIIPRIAGRFKQKPWIILTGTFLLNVITGMRGGSGGSLFPPFLKAVRMDIHKAIATSLFVTIFTAAAAIVVYWNRGNILWLPAVFVASGSMIGARLGSGLSLRTKPVWLEVGLSVLVVFLALLVVYRVIST